MQVVNNTKFFASFEICFINMHKYINTKLCKWHFHTVENQRNAVSSNRMFSSASLISRVGSIHLVIYKKIPREFFKNLLTNRGQSCIM